MNQTLRYVLFLIALMVMPGLGVAVLTIPHNPLDAVTYVLMLLLWLSACLSFLYLLGTYGFFHWVMHGPKTRIIILRPCRCGMSFSTRDGLFHSVEREDDGCLRLACTGGDTGLHPFYVLGKRGRSIGDVPLREQCPRAGCRDAFQSEIHPACPEHGRHRNEPV